MYFDRRLWGFTKGVRLRILWAVFVGLASATVGVARLALLGWPLASVLAGESFESLILPFGVVAAILVLPGLLESARNMGAPRTAAALPLPTPYQPSTTVVHLARA